MATRVLILGAGFGGLELATTLSEELGDGRRGHPDRQGRRLRLRLLEARRDVRPRRRADAVRLPYADFAKPGVRLAAARRSREIDPEARAGDHRRRRPRGRRPRRRARRRLRHGRDARPGRGAATSSTRSPAPNGWPSCCRASSQGRAIVGVCGAPFKCPPAPSEAALLLHDHLTERGVRERLRDHVRDAAAAARCRPRRRPRRRCSPPSPSATSRFLPGRRIASLDAERGVAVLDDGTELPFDLFLGVPKHRAPDVVLASGMTEDGYVPVDSRTLETSFPGVYAVGDVATVGVPKAGVFAEGAARVVAESLIAADPRRRRRPTATTGQGSCYIEFGGGQVGRVDVDFLSGPKPTGTYHEPSARARRREGGLRRQPRAPAGSAARRRLGDGSGSGPARQARRSAARSRASGPGRSRARRRRRRRSPRSGGSR